MKCFILYMKSSDTLYVRDGLCTRPLKKVQQYRLFSTKKMV
ncbi:protein of unknown function [Cupriavidus taiwanensis]|nr:protein of unknown function [Cupriavidus taiwanensis]